MVVFTGKRRQIVLRPRGSDEDVSMMTTGMSAHTHTHTNRGKTKNATMTAYKYITKYAKNKNVHRV